MTESEKFYDEEIAPALRELSDRCRSKGINFLAMAEFNHGEVGLTMAREGAAGPQFRLTSTAATAMGNVDQMMLSLLEWHRKAGSGSLFLKVLEEARNGRS